MKKPLIKWQYQADVTVTAPLQRKGSQLFVQGEGKLISLDLETGSELWQRESFPLCFSEPALRGDQLCSIDAKGHLVLSDLSGNVLDRYQAKTPFVHVSRSSVGSVYASSWLALTHDGELFSFVEASDSFRLDWAYKANLKSFQAPYYLEGSDRLFLTSEDGRLIAIDLETGRELWTWKHSSALFSCLQHYHTDNRFLIHNLVYVGSVDGCLYALNADTGVKVWRVQTDGAISARPVFGNGRVYVTTWGGTTHAIDPDSGELIWTQKASGRLYAQPIVTSRRVYSLDVNGELRSYSSRKGDLKEVFSVAKNIRSTPYLYSNILYTTTQDGLVTAFSVDPKQADLPVESVLFVAGGSSSAEEQGSAMVTGFLVGDSMAEASHRPGIQAVSLASLAQEQSSSSDTEPSALDVTVMPAVAVSVLPTLDDSGLEGFFRGGRHRQGVYDVEAKTELHGKRWTYETQTGARVTADPVLSGGTVFFGDEDGLLYAVSHSSGQLQWAFEVGDCIGAAPLVSGNQVFFGSDDGYFYCLNRRTGDLEWQFAIEDWIRSSPIVSQTMVYFGSDDGCLYALDRNTGAFRWRFQTEDWVRSAPLLVEDQFSSLGEEGAGDALFFGSDDGKMYALHALSGELEWSLTTKNRVRSAPVFADEQLYFSSWDHHLYAVYPDTGKQKWCFDTGGIIYTASAVTKDTIFCGGGGGFGYLHAIDLESGSEKWRFRASASIRSSPSIAGHVVYFGCRDGKLYAVNTYTGELCWDFDANQAIDTSPALTENAVIFGSKNGVVCALS